MKPNTLRLDALIENPDNPQTVTDADFDMLVESIRKLPQTLAVNKIAYVTDYVALDGTDLRGQRVVIAGNKRLRALKRLASTGGLASPDGEFWYVTPRGDAPADWFFDLTPLGPDARRQWLVKSNVQSGEWDAGKLLALYDADELAELMNPDAITDLLSSVSEASAEEPSEDNADTSGEYQKFVDKFKPKLTTDDCYTPEIVYNAIRDWAAREYNLEGREIVRPFYPGGDYQAYDYPPGCVVLDNPPFSIMSEIVKFYAERSIDFFLFAPALTLFSGNATSPNVGYIITGSQITYANGAVVATSFVTSLSDYLAETRPDLYKVIEDANEENLKATAKTLPKLSFPHAVATSARLQYLTKHGIRFAVKRSEAAFIRRLDAQEKGDAIFGGAFLLCERAAAERAAAKTFELSPRELELQRSLTP